MRIPLWGFFLFLACSTESPAGIENRFFKDETHRVSIRQTLDSTFQIVSINRKEDTSTWDLDYPVYQFHFADIDADGKKEILVGVIKSTRFDPQKRKRLFVFKHFEDQIRPQWLGTRLGMPLENFFIEPEGDQEILTAIEIEDDGTYAVSKYRWQRFGFEFVRYEFRSQSKKQIKQLGYEI